MVSVYRTLLKQRQRNLFLVPNAKELAEKNRCSVPSVLSLCLWGKAKKKKKDIGNCLLLAARNNVVGDFFSCSFYRMHCCGNFHRRRHGTVLEFFSQLLGHSYVHPTWSRTVCHWRGWLVGVYRACCTRNPSTLISISHDEKKECQ